MISISRPRESSTYNPCGVSARYRRYHSKQRDERGLSASSCRPRKKAASRAASDAGKRSRNACRARRETSLRRLYRAASASAVRSSRPLAASVAPRPRVSASFTTSANRPAATRCRQRDPATSPGEVRAGATTRKEGARFVLDGDGEGGAPAGGATDGACAVDA